MAYASVASLLQTIDLLNYHQHSSIFPRIKDQITSLHEHTCFLQSFLEDDPNRANYWEETIRDVTDRAEEIIDILVSETLLKSSKSEEVDGGVDELKRVTEEMESTANRMKGRGTKDNADPDAELMEIVSLCLTQAHMGNFIHYLGGFGRFEIQSCRRVSSSNYSHNFLEGIYHSTIRTLILYSANYREVGFRLSSGNVRLLRILDLSNVHDSGFNISKAISNLQNLQTLIICLRENGKFGELPKGIWRMPQLRHIFNFSFTLPTPKQGEAENSALENLETFSRVVDFVCSRENLKMIPNVKKLNIFYTESIKYSIKDIELRNLISLRKLEILKIEMEWSSSPRKHKLSIAFPATLKKLNLCRLQLSWEDMKIVAKLPNLEVLKLRNRACIGKTWETRRGGFSRLTYLMIEESHLQKWMAKSSHFPRLKSLVLRSCLHLSEVPREIGEIPTLQLMDLDGKNLSLVKS